MRKLPKQIINELNDPNSTDARNVIKKYGQPHANIGENDVDYIAFGFMTPEAVLYWLPHFFDYMQNQAEADSFHFELIRQRLVDESWMCDIKEYATPQELNTIQAFIQWLGKQPILDPSDKLGLATFNYMVALWEE